MEFVALTCYVGGEAGAAVDICGAGARLAFMIQVLCGRVPSYRVSMRYHTLYSQKVFPRCVVLVDDELQAVYDGKLDFLDRA